MSLKPRKTDSLLFCAGLIIACSAGLPCYADDAPAPGPALEARQKLLERIQQARSQGMGIGGYMQAFQALEGQVKSGDSEDKIKSRVEAIHKAVNDQMERARILKTQKPLPPQGSQITGSDPIAPQSPSGGKGPGSAGPPPAQGGGGGGDMLSKLKDRFGDKLDAIPDGIKERLMNNPEAQGKIMEKIKERAGGGDAPPAGGPGPGGGGPGGPGGPGGQGAQNRGGD